MQVSEDGKRLFLGDLSVLRNGPVLSRVERCAIFVAASCLVVGAALVVWRAPPFDDPMQLLLTVPLAAAAYGVISGLIGFVMVLNGQADVSLVVLDKAQRHIEIYKPASIGYYKEAVGFDAVDAISIARPGVDESDGLASAFVRMRSRHSIALPERIRRSELAVIDMFLGRGGAGLKLRVAARAS